MAFAGFRAFGCSSCCPNCTIASDTFAANTIASYSTTGSPTITGGELVLNASDGVAHNTAASSEDDATRVTFTIDTAETNATIRAILAWSDWGNYEYGEVEKTGSTWTILVGRRLAGSDTEYTTAVELSSAPTLPATVCLSSHPGETRESESSTLGGGIMPSEVEDTGGGGGGSWSNITRVLADDGSEAQFAFPSSGTTEDTDALVIRWLGLLVPVGSTIAEVRVTIQATGGGVLWTVIDKDAILSSGLSTFADKATGVAFGTAEERTYVWTDVTWEDLPTLAFTMVFQRSTAFTGGSVTVDYLGSLAIDYTTPEQTPGRLRMSINGECVTEYSAENPAGGLKAGVRSQAGDWDVDSFDYRYAQSEARPTCGYCTENDECEPPGGGDPTTYPPVSCDICCTSPLPLGAMTLDFGVGGWTTPGTLDPCGGPIDTDCETLMGVVELGSIRSCMWRYTNFYNPVGLEIECGWAVVLYLVQDGANCRWEAAVMMTHNASNILSRAVYRSDPFANTECQVLPVVLTKVVEIDGPTTAACDGNLPATITLEAA